MKQSNRLFFIQEQGAEQETCDKEKYGNYLNTLGIGAVCQHS